LGFKSRFKAHLHAADILITYAILFILEALTLTARRIRRRHWQSNLSDEPFQAGNDQRNKRVQLIFFYKQSTSVKGDIAP
jgi:hypothetical protein